MKSYGICHMVLSTRRSLYFIYLRVQEGFEQFFRGLAGQLWHVAYKVIWNWNSYRSSIKFIEWKNPCEWLYRQGLEVVNIILLTTTGNSHVVIPKENVTQSSFQEESKAWILINSQSSSSDLGSIMLLGISNMNSCQHFKISVTTTFGQGGILLRIFFFLVLSSAYGISQNTLWRRGQM